MFRVNICQNQKKWIPTYWHMFPLNDFSGLSIGNPGNFWIISFFNCRVCVSLSPAPSSCDKNKNYHHKTLHVLNRNA